MDYIAVHFEIEPFSEENTEILEACIEELGFESFTIEDPMLNAFIPKESYNPLALNTLLGAISPLSCGFTFKQSAELIAEQNWNALWESDFDPVVVADTVTVKAVYHKGLPLTKYNIVINPEMSFGSGHHQTTCMMIEWLLEEKKALRGASLLDMGCGTGILAILAAKFGAAVPVHAIDIDPVCVRSAAANARRNRVPHKVKVLCGDALLLQSGRYDVILANINRNILLEDMSTYARSLRPGGRLFISGFYAEDIPMLLEEAARCGLSSVALKEDENWASVKLVND